LKEKELIKISQNLVFGRKFDSRAFRNKQLVALWFLFILSMPILVDSQNQGLTWGFDAGKRFYFEETDTLHRNESIVGSLSFRYYIVANNNYTITDPLTLFPLAKEKAYFHNGSLVPPPGPGYFGFAVPIGNWDLLETVFISQYSIYYDEISIIDEETKWGFQTSRNSTELEESRRYVFSKSDGVLLTLQFETTPFVGPITSKGTHIDRINAPLPINSILFVAYSSIILIVLVGVYFSRKPRVK
jgi:hypothetical protein